MGIARPDCSTELGGTSRKIIHEELLSRLTGFCAACFHQICNTPVGLGICLGKTALG